MTRNEQAALIHQFLLTVFQSGDLIELRGWGSVKMGPMRVLTADLQYAAEVGPNMTTLGAHAGYLLNPISRDSPYSQKSAKDDLCFSSFAARDGDTACRNLYLIDVDSHHPDGPATAEQRAAALEVADSVRGYLSERGWPEPIVVDSGNGVHLLYKGDRCAADGSTLKLALEHLSKRFSIPGAATIDTCVFNPARVARLPYTLNRKAGRLSSVISYPASFEAVNAGKIYALAVEGGLRTDYGVRTTSASSSRELLWDEEDVEDFCAEFELELGTITHDGDATYFALDSCPFKGGEHRGQNVGKGKTTIILRPDSIGFSCFSDDCSGHTFFDLLRLLHGETGHWPQKPIYAEDIASLDLKWGDAAPEWASSDAAAADDEEDDADTDPTCPTPTPAPTQEETPPMQYHPESLTAVYRYQALALDADVAALNPTAHAAYRAAVERTLREQDHPAMLARLAPTVGDVIYDAVTSPEEPVFWLETEGCTLLALALTCDYALQAAPGGPR